MIWLLIVIHLGGDPVSVVNTQIIESFHSKQECIKKIREFHVAADENDTPVPDYVNMGCTPFRVKGA